MWHTRGTLSEEEEKPVNAMTRSSVAEARRAAAAGLQDTRDRALAAAGADDPYRTLELASEFLGAAEALVGALCRDAGLDAASAEVVTAGTLQAAFPALAALAAEGADAACRELEHAWAGQLRALGLAPRRAARVAEATALYVAGRPRSDAEEAMARLAVYNAAVGAWLANRRHGDQARRILQRLMTALELSREQLARMFEVTAETIRRWEYGRVNVPAQRLAELTRADAAVTRLLHLFLPDRLPAVVRRKAEAFGGESAFDWMLRGRIADVADTYERLLAYQG